MPPLGKLRLPMILAVCLWSFIWIAPYILRGRRDVLTGIELISCILFVTLFWVDRRNNYWKMLFCVFFVAFAIPYFFQRDAVSMAQGALCLFVGYWWFRSGRDGADDERTLKLHHVKAKDLSGVVEYDSLYLAGVSVEECTEDWTQQVSQVKTDDDGRFELPPSDGQIHFLRVSRPGAGTVHLRVELVSKARPMEIRLKPRRVNPFL